MEQYKKPVYNPLEVFKPSKSFLKEVIKQLKQRCYEIIKEKEKLKREISQLQTSQAFGQACLLGKYGRDLEERHEKILRRIFNYENYIRRNKSSPIQKESITDLDIARARQYPITQLYQGRLRKSGARMYGTCELHSEKSASCVFYPDNTFHCFGCGAHGDVIDYYCKINNTNFKQAIKSLL